MINAGQVCVAIKRAYVPKSMYDEFCDEMQQLAGQAVVDDGMCQGATLGPVQHAAQYTQVKDLLDDARESGNVIAGGSAQTGDASGRESVGTYVYMAGCAR